jgi:hypothetical protein
VITLVAIDPGTTNSAYVAMSGRDLQKFGKIQNDEMIKMLDFVRLESDQLTILVVEMMTTSGMPAGREMFDTCVWIGRFIERWSGKHATMLRPTVKAHICGSVAAKDGNVRAALLERYGGKVAAIGNVKAKGPLYGVANDVWQALALAVAYREKIVDAGSGRGLLR